MRINVLAVTVAMLISFNNFGMENKTEPSFLYKAIDIIDSMVHNSSMKGYDENEDNKENSGMAKRLADVVKSFDEMLKTGQECLNELNGIDNH